MPNHPLLTMMQIIISPVQNKLWAFHILEIFVKIIKKIENRSIMPVSSILIIGHHKISNGITNARQDFRRTSRQKTCPYGQSCSGRLSFRLRKLQRNAKHPVCPARSARLKNIRSRDSVLSVRHSVRSEPEASLQALRYLHSSLQDRRLNPVMPLNPRRGRIIDSATVGAM